MNKVDGTTALLPCRWQVGALVTLRMQFRRFAWQAAFRGKAGLRLLLATAELPSEDGRAGCVAAALAYQEYSFRLRAEALRRDKRATAPCR